MSYVNDIVLIVLGASPENLGLYRVEKAAELYHTGILLPNEKEKRQIRRLILTGKDESETLRDLAINKYNVRREDTDLEDRSKSTAGNMYWVKELCLPKIPDIEKLPIGITTQEWHWDPRTRFLAGRFFPGKWYDNPDLLAPDNRPPSEIGNSKRMEKIAYYRDMYYSLPFGTSGLLFVPYDTVTEFLERKLLRK